MEKVKFCCKFINMHIANYALYDRSGAIPDIVMTMAISQLFVLKRSYLTV